MAGIDPALRPPNGETRPRRLGNLAMRVLSALVLAPVAVGAAYYGDWPFAVLWAAAAVAVLWEWTTLVAPGRSRMAFSVGTVALVVAALMAELDRPITASLLVLLGAVAVAIFSSDVRRAWVCSGVVYAGILLLAPIVVRGDAALGFAAVVLIFAVVWTTDVLGYFGGRVFGGPKLAPAISPKKTWSGAITGTTGALLAALAWRAAWPQTGLMATLVLALALSVSAQAGDLLESAIKRRFNAKDASQLIPGHGGVMDRLDGFWAATLLAALIGLIRGGFDASARGLLLW